MSILQITLLYPKQENDACVLAMIWARVAKKDPAAINALGGKYCHGKGIQKDTQRAVGLWEEAAELGSIDALYNLGFAHGQGVGVQQDEAKAAEFWAKAAMQGDVDSRHNLGRLELKKGNPHRAVRHYLISSKMGGEKSLEAIKIMSMTFKAGLATKEQYAEALRGYQDAVEETMSHDRDEAKRLLAN